MSRPGAHDGGRSPPRIYATQAGLALTFEDVDVKNFFILFLLWFMDLEECR